jgi:hypothetical protein
VSENCTDSFSKSSPSIPSDRGATEYIAVMSHAPTKIPSVNTEDSIFLRNILRLLYGTGNEFSALEAQTFSAEEMWGPTLTAS